MTNYFLKIFHVLVMLLFQTPGSILGFNWATNSEVKCIERERQALLKFKQGLIDDFGMLSTWRDDENNGDCCKWKGVECNNETGQIDTLDLRASEEGYLRGVINITLLIELQNMEYLDLSSNFFWGSHIPELMNSFTKLIYLNLSYSRFVGRIPYQLENILQLQFLDLKENYLAGAIPYQLGNLTQLQYLDLEGNFLEGAIPYQLGNLAQLQYLDLEGNFLDGAIPYQLGNLAQLQYLNLKVNNLEGAIPYQLENLAQLQYLNLKDNNLDGAIPFQVGNLPILQSLVLGGKYDFKINDQNHVAEWLSTLTSLTDLDLTLHNLGYSRRWLQTIGKLLSNLRELRLSGCTLSDVDILPLFDSHSNISTSLTILDLSNNLLTSSTVQWVFNFSSLVILDFSYNKLTSSIFQGNLNFGSKIQELYLQNCTLSDSNFLVSSASNMNLSSSLVIFDLSQNQLTSSNIFHWLFNFTTNLRMLHLDGNLLEGHIPNGFGNMMNSLEYLSLNSNKLQGKIPTSFGNISTLHMLDLGHNKLIGEIPKSIGLLYELETLFLEGNSLEGEVTESHFTNLSKLKALYLSNNSLFVKFGTSWVPPFQLIDLELSSCKLGPSFPSWVKTQSYLRYLYISNNGINDFVPEWFWSKFQQLNGMDMSRNNFTGTIPNSQLKLTNKPSITLNSNQFEGVVPSFLLQASELILSENKFSNLDSLLCGNWETTNLATLDLSNNQIKGQLPDCWEHLQLLQFLDLSDNKLSGKIPLSMGNLVKLEALVLRNNSLIGELPSTLINCTNLVMLDVGENMLSGPIPSWIGESLQQLIILSLKGNCFSENLPLHLCYLRQIQVLDLSRNNLSSGIPKCLKNFSTMSTKSINSSEALSHIYWNNITYFDMILYPTNTYRFNISLMWKGVERRFKDPELRLQSIDLSSNNLTGEIPKELGCLLGLVSLNLSRNNLSGEIPSEIGNLNSLEFLDLSKNHIFGKIPSSLSQIDRLAALDLSNNHLCGKIPLGTQLQSFNASTFEGNLDLCGKPLDKTCPKDETPVQPEEELPMPETDDNSVFSEALYISLGLGYFTGFWAFLGPILLWRNWRNAYLKFLNKWVDYIYVMLAVNVARCHKKLKG